MKAPRCRSCGCYHWDRVCPTTAPPSSTSEQSRVHGVTRATTVMPRLESPKPSSSATTVPPDSTTSSVKEPGGKLPFDRVAYQREYMRQYMRERRAKAKLSP